MKKLILFFALTIFMVPVFSQGFPVANDDYYTLNVGDTLDLNILDNDIEIGGIALRIMESQLSSSDDITIHYIARRSNVGEKEYTYYACPENDPFAYSNQATIHITVIGEPYIAPRAINDTIRATVNELVSIDVFENDYFPSGEIIFTSIQNIRKQSLGYAIKHEHGNFEFFAFDHPGTESVFYDIESMESDFSDTALIVFEVTEGTPSFVAVNDHYSTKSGKAIEMHILDNDQAAGSVSLIEFTSNFFATDHHDYIRYSPSMIFTGVDSIRYTCKLDDQDLYDDAWIYINVLENDSIPVAQDDTAEAMSCYANEFDVLANDNLLGMDCVIRISAPSAQGKINTENNKIEFTPTCGFEGETIIGYRLVSVENPNVISNEAFVTVAVTLYDNRPVAVADTIDVNSSQFNFINTILDNDSDPMGHELEIDDVKWDICPFFANIFLPDSILFSTNSININAQYIFLYRIRRVDQPDVKSEYAQLVVNYLPDPEKMVLHPDTIYCSAPDRIAVDLLANDELHGATVTSILSVSMIGSSDFSPVLHCGTLETDDDLSTYFIPSINMSGWHNILYSVRDEDNNTAIGTIAVFLEEPYTHSAGLNINNLCGLFNSNGINFNNSTVSFNSTDPEYYYNPDGFCCDREKKIIGYNNSSLWITGTSESDYIHFSGDRTNYYLNCPPLPKDFQPGPISTAYDLPFIKEYHRVWKLDRGMIANHINHYTEAGYEPAEPILNWPGNGSQDLGQAEQLAPYYDRNENGIYEPMDGDYPLIRGDQAIFFMFNDDLDHTESFGMRMKVEIHGMAYAFNRGDETLDNTLLVHYDIYNRSTRTYHNAFIGSYSDMILGNYSDNRCATDVALTSYFYYNGDKFDEDKRDSYETEIFYPGFGFHPGALSTTFLGGPFMDEDGEDNPAGGCDESINGSGFDDGIPDNERYGLTNTAEPDLFFNSASYFEWPYQYANSRNHLMQSIGSEDASYSHMKYGGYGFESRGAYGPECKFMFPWESDPCNWGLNGEEPNGPKDWRHLYSGVSTPGYVRMIGSCGPFTFEPGQKQEFDIAYVYARDFTDESNFPSVTLLKERIADLLQKRDLGELYPYFETETGMQQQIGTIKTALIYPSPAKEEINIVASISGEASYTLYNNQGERIMQGTLQQKNNHQINIQHLNSGLYIIRIQDQQTIYSGKFLVK